MAAVVNLSIDQGSKFEYLFQLSGAAQMDLTDAAVRGAMKSEYESNNAILFTSSIVGSNVTISLTSGQTANLNPGTWVYDVIVINQANDVIRAVQGRVTVTPQVTPFP